MRRGGVEDGVLVESGFDEVGMDDDLSHRRLGFWGWRVVVLMETGERRDGLWFCKENEGELLVFFGIRD